MARISPELAKLKALVATLAQQITERDAEFKTLLEKLAKSDALASFTPQHTMASLSSCSEKRQIQKARAQKQKRAKEVRYSQRMTFLSTYLFFGL